MSYAIVFTTYAWDDFVARQYERLRARCLDADLFIMLDAIDQPPIPVPHGRVLSLDRAGVGRLLGEGACTVETGPWGSPRTLWWNLDYYLYAFFDAHPEYDYCLMLDFDAWIDLDVDALVSAVAARGVAFVAEPHRDMARWAWTALHEPTYPRDIIHGALLAVTIVSRNAARYLRGRRAAMAGERRAGRVPFWPFCEAFVATELAAVGFRVAALSAFGDTTRYGWHPAQAEARMVELAPRGFIHPVRPVQDPGAIDPNRSGAQT